VEEALKRILNRTYGLCEETGKPLPVERLKAVPWARFAREVEARLENEGAVKRPHLGALGSVREEGHRSAQGASQPRLRQRGGGCPVWDPVASTTEGLNSPKLRPRTRLARPTSGHESLGERRTADNLYFQATSHLKASGSVRPKQITVKKCQIPWSTAPIHA
jgi:hypothetical protein